MTEVGGEATSASLELRRALIRCCELAGWPPQHLGAATQSPGLEEALLEIIACRDAEATLLSLELITCCESLGWRSPWLDDNRARLMIHGGEEAEALRIWQELSQHPEPAVAAIAADTLQALHQRPAQAVRADRIRQLRERDQPDQWRALLLEGLLNSDDADDAQFQALFREIALDLQPPEESPWDPELLLQELRLQLFADQLERWEQC